MGSIKILDCTLRDGGYCNGWEFGYSNINKIVSGLGKANIEIIETGFLTNKFLYNSDKSLYSSMDQVEGIISNHNSDSMYVCMMNYGEYDVTKIPAFSNKTIDGVRVAFHKKDMIQALEVCKKIKDKGYKVFIQAMVSLSYNDEEFLDLIYKCNEIEPYAFYIVDSFGVMKRKDLTRLFYMVEHNLNEDIAIGYHSHNNMQLAYSNAQALVDIRTKRDLIIDSSVYGMGRGAGNLNTELFMEYLNDCIGTKYEIKPVLNIIDEILNEFYQKEYWGYSLPNYLSAAYNVHPNYARYLDKKKTLTIDNMNDIFAKMNGSKKGDFDKEYIENVYMEYMKNGTVDESHTDEFIRILSGRKVLLIAPGASSVKEADSIKKYIEKTKAVTIGINFDYSLFETDYIFISNKRRFRELDQKKYDKSIVTSNIPVDIKQVYIKTDYQSLTNSYDNVRDNAGLMLIKYLAQLGVTKIGLAGMDGYYVSADADELDNESSEKLMNIGIQNAIKDFSKKMDIEFITSRKYI